MANELHTNVIKCINALQVVKNSTPTLSSCGNYLAYITTNQNNENKLIVRLLSEQSGDYHIVFEKNLSKLYQEQATRREESIQKNLYGERNRIQQFLEEHYIKGTFKTINDYESRHSSSRSDQSTNNKNSKDTIDGRISKKKGNKRSRSASSVLNLPLGISEFHIKWEALGGSRRCCKIGILDTRIHIFYAFSITPEFLELQAVIQNDLSNEFKVVQFEWIADAHDKLDSKEQLQQATDADFGSDFIAFFYEHNLTMRVFQLSSGVFVQEINKPKYSRILARSLLLNKGDYDEYENGIDNDEYNVFSIIQRDQAADYVQTFKVLKSKYSRKVLIPISKFKLATDLTSVAWSLTGKWLCGIDSNLNISLYNVFGLGSAKANSQANFRYILDRVGLPSLKYKLENEGMGQISNTTWGLISTNMLGIRSNQQHCAILENSAEILLVGDNQANVHVFATNIGLNLLFTLKHRSEINFAKTSEDLAIWSQQMYQTLPISTSQPSSIPIFKKITKFHTISNRYVLPSRETDIDSNGIESIQLDMAEKTRALSLLSNNDFIISYFDFLLKIENLAAVRSKSMPNVVFVWDLNICLKHDFASIESDRKENGLVTVITTLKPILEVSWHPQVPNLLLICTSSDLILWSHLWNSPLTLKPTFAAKTTKVTIDANGEETENADTALGGHNISRRGSHSSTFSLAGINRNTIISAEWITSKALHIDTESGVYKDGLRILCSSASGKFTVIKIKLNNSQSSPLKELQDNFKVLYESTMGKTSDLFGEYEDAKLFFFTSNDEKNEAEGSEDSSSLMIVDDDTNALRIMRGVQQQDWVHPMEKIHDKRAPHLYNLQRRDSLKGVDEDTFGFKRKGKQT